MNGGMTVRAPGVIRPGRFNGNIPPSFPPVNVVPCMALQAKKRLPDAQQVLVDRTMRPVTILAIIHNIGMFIQERASLAGMALDTGFLDRILFQHVGGKTAVRIMAVNAKYAPFPQRMMTGKGEFHLGRLMAAETQTARFLWRYLEVRALMDVMTIKAGDIIKGMCACIPVMQIKGCIA